MVVCEIMPVLTLYSTLVYAYRSIHERIVRVPDRAKGACGRVESPTEKRSVTAGCHLHDIEVDQVNSNETRLDHDAGEA